MRVTIINNRPCLDVTIEKMKPGVRISGTDMITNQVISEAFPKMTIKNFKPKEVKKPIHQYHFQYACNDYVEVMYEVKEVNPDYEVDANYYSSDDDDDYFISVPKYKRITNVYTEKLKNRIIEWKNGPALIEVISLEEEIEVIINITKI